MKLHWTDALFDRVAAETCLGPDTLLACRKVLIPPRDADGLPVRVKKQDVATEFGFQLPHLSRALAQLNGKLIEMGDLSDPGDLSMVKGALSVERVTSRDVAVQRAREFIPNLAIQEALPGRLYVGKPLVRTDQHLVQLSGGHNGQGEVLAVLHDLSKLQRVPDMTAPVIEVSYPARGGLAAVQEKVPGQVRGGRSR